MDSHTGSTKIVTGVRKYPARVKFPNPKIHDDLMCPDDSLRTRSAGRQHTVNIGETIQKANRTNKLLHLDTLLGKDYSSNVVKSASRNTYMTSVTANFKPKLENHIDQYYSENRRPRERTFVDPGLNPTELKAINNQTNVDDYICTFIRAGSDDVSPQYIVSPSFSSNISLVAPDLEVTIPEHVLDAKYASTYHANNLTYLNEFDKHAPDVYGDSHQQTNVTTLIDEYNDPLDKHTLDVYGDSQQQTNVTTLIDEYNDPLDKHTLDVIYDVGYRPGAKTIIKPQEFDFSYVTPDVSTESGFKLSYVSNPTQYDYGYDRTIDPKLTTNLDTYQNTGITSIPDLVDLNEYNEGIHPEYNVTPTTTIQTNIKHEPFYREKKPALSQLRRHGVSSAIPTMSTNIPRVKLRCKK